MPKRLAIIGAGPIGIEAALRGVAAGWEVSVFERDRIGAHLLRWSHVRFFSPFKDNVSAFVLQSLSQKPAADAFLTGKEFVERALLPAALSPALQGKIREGIEVKAVGKRRLIKTELPNHPLRGDRPFQLLLRNSGTGAESVVEADRVLDATGVYGNPNGSGESGLPCPGERTAAAIICRHLPDIVGRDESDWIGRKILVIGDGHSAATAVHWLKQLQEKNADTHVAWVVNVDRSRPCVEVADDPLPERKRTVHSANEAAERPPAGWNVFRKSALLEIRPGENGFWAATVGRGEDRRTLRVQKILSLTGYRPDTSTVEELQVQISPITGGAGMLAKSLLGVTDCLAPVNVPPEQLESGERGYFMIGHKSYGRLNTFLLRSGLEQLDLIFRRL